MKKVLLGLSVLLGQCLGGEVLCPVEEYVRVGLEFEGCQKAAMDKFSKEGKEEQLCPTVKKMAKVCASSVKRCFTPRGYERGMQIFFDSMSSAMPEVTACPVIAESGDGLDQLRPGERCSVREEIDSVQAVGRCSTRIKAGMANRIQRGVAAAMRRRGGANDEIDNDGEFDFLERENELDSEDFGGGDEELTPQETMRRQRNMLCDMLNSVKEECMMPNLRRCYVGHDFDAHLAYLLESLKISGNLIAISLTNVTDVPDCPVFARGNPVGGVDVVAEQTDDGSTVSALVAALSTVVAVVVIAALALVVFKLRLVPRIKAWAANVPYDDMLVNSGPAHHNPGDDNRNVQAMERRSSEREEEEAHRKRQGDVDRHVP